jgi:hypothetical protein
MATDDQWLYIDLQKSRTSPPRDCPNAASYEISTEKQSAFPSTFLSATQMLEIASREDFPKEYRP